MRTTTMSMTEIKERATKWGGKDAQVYDRGDYVEIEIDAHGLSVREALVYARNMINLIRCPFKLSVIHGFHRGQAIMTALRTDFGPRWANRIGKMTTDYWNPGVTHFWINGDGYIQAYAS